jgi:hypothetical protein
MPGSGPTIPATPEKFAHLAYEIAVSYFIYNLTH